MDSSQKVTRSKFIAALCSIFSIPFISKASAPELDQDVESDDYEILLKQDGSTVKVKKNNLRKSKTIKKGMSNPTLKSWLKK